MNEVDKIRAEREEAYNKSGFIVHEKSWHTTGKRYKSVAMAKAAMKRSKRWDKVTPKYPADEYIVVSGAEYKAGDILVETYNLLNPGFGPIMIPRSQKGTACDPGTERYHSM